MEIIILELSAVIITPLVALATLRQRWAFLFLLASVPFHALKVITILSYSFNPPEIAILILGGHLAVDWFRNGNLSIPNARPLLLLWAFLGVAALSIIWAVAYPTSVLIHPYGVPFQTQLFIDATINRYYITQFLLRGLFVFAVTILSIFLVRFRQIDTAIRGLVYGAVLTGFVGILYQASIIFDISTVSNVLKTIGLKIPNHPGNLGSIPLMYSLSGEPGFTADYLLYGLAIVIPFSIFSGDCQVFSPRELRGVTLFLAGTLLLTTASTGYGGLLILTVTMLALLVLFPTSRPTDFHHYLAFSSIFILLFLFGLFIILGPTLMRIITYVIGELSFQAGSGNIRMYYILRSLDVFLARPLLGAGVGSHAAPSYLPVLLAETGIAGATLLIGAHLYPLRQCAGLIASTNANVSQVSSVLVVASLTLLATNLIAKSIASLLMPWYWFSIALPIAYVLINDKNTKNEI